VASDGFNLAISEGAIGAAPCAFLIPQRAVSHLLGMEGFVLRIRVSDSALTFETETDLLRVGQGAQHFVPYRRVLPQRDATTTITIADKEALLAAMNRCLAMGDREKPIVECNVEANGRALFIKAGVLRSHGNKYQLQDSAAAVGALVVGPAIDFSFDAQDTLRFLNKAVAPIVIHVISNTTVLEFRANGGQYRFLKMPTSPDSRTIGAAAK
jgi:hypothetical protein